MAIKRNIDSFTENEVMILIAATYENIDITFETEGQLISQRQRLYILKKAIIDAYDKKQKLTEPYPLYYTKECIDYAPKMTKLTMTKQGLTLTIGVHVFSSTVSKSQDILGQALAKTGMPSSYKAFMLEQEKLKKKYDEEDKKTREGLLSKEKPDDVLAALTSADEATQQLRDEGILKEHNKDHPIEQAFFSPLKTNTTPHPAREKIASEETQHTYPDGAQLSSDGYVYLPNGKRMPQLIYEEQIASLQRSGADILKEKVNELFPGAQFQDNDNNN